MRFSIGLLNVVSKRHWISFSNKPKQFVLRVIREIVYRNNLFIEAWLCSASTNWHKTFRYLWDFLHQKISKKKPLSDLPLLASNFFKNIGEVSCPQERSNEPYFELNNVLQQRKYQRLKNKICFCFECTVIKIDFLRFLLVLRPCKLLTHVTVRMWKPDCNFHFHFSSFLNKQLFSSQHKTNRKKLNLQTCQKGQKEQKVNLKSELTIQTVPLSDEVLKTVNSIHNFYWAKKCFRFYFVC